MPVLANITALQASAKFDYFLYHHHTCHNNFCWPTDYRRIAQYHPKWSTKQRGETMEISRALRHERIMVKCYQLALSPLPRLDV